MNANQNEKIIAYLTLLSGLSVSAVAVYYSVVGLASMFAAAAVPVIIMGIALEVSKLVAASWLKMHWDSATMLIRSYLIVAVMVLMSITSLGIFGFLSRAHLDQVAPAVEISAKIQSIDKQIAIENQNIVTANAALQQLDLTVNETLTRSTTEAGAVKSEKLRKSQSAERVRIRKEVQATQLTIQNLTVERDKLESNLRKVEAEVGPIKYLAAFVYGDTSPQLLEKAVTWVIIMLIVVFDPLAVVLLLAAQTSFQKLSTHQDTDFIEAPSDESTSEVDPNTSCQEDIIAAVPEQKIERSIFEDHPYLLKPFVHFQNLKPVVFPSKKPESLFVQNEEQSQSNKWTTVSTASNITQQQYLKAAQEYLLKR